MFHKYDPQEILAPFYLMIAGASYAQFKWLLSKAQHPATKMKGSGPYCNYSTGIILLLTTNKNEYSGVKILLNEKFLYREDNKASVFNLSSGFLR